MNLLDLILHFDATMNIWIEMTGSWIYVILTLIIFAESGLVFCPFLPGDSLLFVVGALTATAEKTLDIYIVLPSLVMAAIVGGIVNYYFGSALGRRLDLSRDRWWLRQAHLEKTHQFYEKHGGKTVVMARFIPIVRTFAPFVAGLAAMPWKKFWIFNTVGGLFWVLSIVFVGRSFGNLPIIKENFGLVVPLIIVISVAPILWEWLRSLQAKRSN